MEQAFHTTHIDNDDDQILIASWNPTRNPPYHCYRLVVADYVKTRKADLINNEIRDSCNKSARFAYGFITLVFCTYTPIGLELYILDNKGGVFLGYDNYSVSSFPSCDTVRVMCPSLNGMDSLRWKQVG